MRKRLKILWDAYRHYRAADGLVQDVLAFVGWKTSIGALVTGLLTLVGARLSHLARVQQFVLVLVAFAAVPFLVHGLHLLRGKRLVAGLPPLKGATTWNPERVKISIPPADNCARLGGTQKREYWADGLAHWEEWSVHNLWANRPTTREDFVLWRQSFRRWCDDVKAWMESAGCSYLDVKDFSVLGNVSDQPYHSDPSLSHELAMLDLHRDRLRGLANQYRNTTPLQATPQRNLKWEWRGNLADPDEHWQELMHLSFEPTADSPDIERARIYGMIDGVRHDFRWSVNDVPLPAECTLRRGHPANVCLLARFGTNGQFLGTTVECSVCYVTDEQFIQFHKAQPLASGEHRVDITVTGADQFTQTFSLVIVAWMDRRIEWRPIGG